VEKFDALWSKAMYVTIKRVFGESASELIYRQAERQAFLRREQLGENVEVFQAYLQRLVGMEISQIILAASLKALCITLQREYEEIENHFSFLDELYRVKFKLLPPSSFDTACSPSYN